MRAALSQFTTFSPATLNEALRLLADNPDLRPLAGGTDVLVELNEGVVHATQYLDLSQVQELRGVRREGDDLVLGSRTTFRECQVMPLIEEHLPLLTQASREVGGVQIQNAGTLGGNIANGSPAADGVPPLLVADAQVLLASAKGARWVPLSQYFTGYRQSVRQKNELIVVIKVPCQRGHASRLFRKVGTRRAQAISKLVFSAEAQANEAGVLQRVRLALGSVAPIPLRLVQVEQRLEGQKPSPELLQQAAKTLQQEINPIDDIRSSARYRRWVAQNLLLQFLQDLPGSHA